MGKFFEPAGGRCKIGVRNVTDDHTVEFDTDFSEVPEMFTFKIYMYSIFYNLITNSMKYKNRNRRKDNNKNKKCKKRQ